MVYQTEQSTTGIGAWQLAQALASTRDDIRDRYLAARAHAEEEMDRAREGRARAEEHLRRARVMRAEARATCQSRTIAGSAG